MAQITIEYSDPNADPETATVLLDGEPVIFLARGDDEDHTLLVKLATNARTVAEAVAARYEDPTP
jgi:hypothetical protein